MNFLLYNMKYTYVYDFMSVYVYINFIHICRREGSFSRDSHLSWWFNGYFEVAEVESGRPKVVKPKSVILLMVQKSGKPKPVHKLIYPRNFT